MGTAQEERAKRLEELKQIFYRSYLQGKTPEYTRLVAELSMHWGATEALVKQYISLFINSKFVQWNRETGYVWMTDDYAEQMRKNEFNQTLYT